MIYLDTNIYVYAFSKNVDNQDQKITSQKILEKSIIDKTLLVSDVILYEYAFVANKLKEDKQVIKNNLDFLSKYQQSPPDISSQVINLMSKTSSFNQSFDVYHLCFSDFFKCEEFITFDKGFNKFKNTFDINIQIL